MIVGEEVMRMARLLYLTSLVMLLCFTAGALTAQKPFDCSAAVADLITIRGGAKEAPFLRAIVQAVRRWPKRQRAGVHTYINCYRRAINQLQVAPQQLAEELVKITDAYNRNNSAQRRRFLNIRFDKWDGNLRDFRKCVNATLE